MLEQVKLCIAPFFNISKGSRTAVNGHNTESREHQYDEPDITVSLDIFPETEHLINFSPLL